MLANKNVYQFQHCWNALEIENSLYISGLFDNFYVKNKFFHFCQNGIFGSDLVISDGISIRREENRSAIKVNHTNKVTNMSLVDDIIKQSESDTMLSLTQDTPLAFFSPH